MRRIGVSVYGIRTPLICRGDNLPVIAANALCAALDAERLVLKSSDVVGVTESIVAKAQGNFATVEDIAADIRAKFADNTVGVIFPILSRNRFFNILKGISLGAKRVCVLLQYPQDEVGNPIMDMHLIDELENELDGLLPAAEFRRITGKYKHPFTGVDYIELYEQISDNIEIYFSRDPRDILKLTSFVLVSEIHSRERTKARLIKAGAKTVYTLADILCEPVNNSGYNPDYGVLGSNLSAGAELKLFPRGCDAFINSLREELLSLLGVAPEILVYGDGAFKDPVAGIWELADPVVSPGHTERLTGSPDEIKLKLASDELLADLPEHEKQAAVTKLIREKSSASNVGGCREGTTPRMYADLLGSLCDLTSGSGDKGTPMVLIKGYFDDYASE